MRLSIENVSKRYEDRFVVDHFSTELTEGIYGLLGPNGSGKTTLMRMLATVLKPTTGTIMLDGQDIMQLDSHYREQLGYLPQHIGVYKHFTAEKFLLYMASLKGLDRETAYQQVDHVLQVVNLSQSRKVKLGKFSGGMKQRVGIAQALLNNPKILIIDEPTAGLDPKERIRFRNLLSEIASNRIVIVSTHIVSDIESIAKEVLLIRDGSLLTKKTPYELLNMLRGVVWSVQTDETEFRHIQQQFKIGTILRNDKGLEVRIVSETAPHPRATPKEPNLEDLYLFYFDQEVAV